MHIFYIISQYVWKSEPSNALLDNTSGVNKKILAQATALQHLNVDTDLVVLKINSRNPIQYICDYFRSLNVLIAFIKNLDDSDIIYFRGTGAHIRSYIVCILNRKCKIVLELQSIEKDEYKITSQLNFFQMMKKTYFYFSDKLFGAAVKSRCDGIVSVTDEISNYNRNLTKNKLKYLTLGNGIDVSSLPLRQTPKHDNVNLHVLCVARFQIWHGLDRFILGMSEYSGDKKIYLHLVGDGSELENLKKLVIRNNLGKEVIFYGLKSGEELDAIFNKCHIAVDAISGSRKKLTELSSLKSREYCSRGIPFIIASTDADFPNTLDYILKIPDDESSVDMGSVIEFTENILSNPDHAISMRDYALTHLDWSVKMKILREFLLNV